MDKELEKRHSEHGIDKMEVDSVSQAVGVGGRQGDSVRPPGGGGYLDICTVLNFAPPGEQKKRDPRMEELKKMGLQQSWLRVAEEIGVDAFLRTWRILDGDPGNYGDSGRLKIPLRRYSSYLKFQRNRYIETLMQANCSAQEIRERLKRQLCEQISLRHISRIQKKG